MRTNEEFGQPDTIYGSDASLIVAVSANKSRFSPETHALVAQLLQSEISI